jgi:SRSO17 transposase
VKKNETSHPATGVATRLFEFCGMITDLFAKTRKRAENNAKHAKDYIHGLLSETPRKNSEAIADALQGTQEQDLQNFISDSSWDHTDVFAHVAREANRRIGGQPETMLAVDESCFTKKGRFSAGVGRMYNGHLGKVDNCQVGVFSSLTNGSNATLIGARLLLPAEWIKDEERCLKAGIPTDKIKAASKIDFARELIEQADAHGVQYARIGLDSFYGRDIALLCWIQDRGGEFYGDIPENTYIWLDEPTGGKRPPTPAKHGAIKANQLSNNKDAWKKSKRIKIRNGENGPVIVDSLVRRVWVWPTEEGSPRQWWLLISKDKGGKIKHTLSNAPCNAHQEQLARHQGQRHFIERNFQNSKSHLGMADYQVRKWSGWHRHMAMVALAGLFVMEERMLNHKALPLLSTRDVVQILDWYFRENPTLDSIIEQIENRHHRRRRVSKSKIKISAKNERKIAYEK